MGESAEAKVDTVRSKRARIRATHEADLRWYFERGIRQFEQASNLQAQLEKLSLYGEHARPCKKCGGDTEKGKPGSGFITSDEDFKRRRELAALLGAAFDLPGDLTCPKCGGKGWVPGSRSRSRGALTAKPTRSSVQGNGVPDTGGTESMARLGLISRRLSAVRRLDPLASAALEAFYAPSGGSAACLWHLTPSGRTMLRENGQRLPERAFFENLRDAQERNPTDKRRRQFEAADQQAGLVEERMHTAWCQAVEGAE